MGFERRDGVWWFVAPDHATNWTARAFFDGMAALEDAESAPRVIVDLRAVEDLDAEGRRAVYSLLKRARPERSHMAIVGAAPFHKLLFNFFAHLNKRFSARYFTNEDAAMDWLEACDVDG